MKQTKEKPARLTAWIFAVLAALTVMIWGMQTNWGAVKIERLTLIGENGTKLSSLIYIPETATKETPAPCVVIYHGTSNQAHSNDTWSMEFARRGYVVISPDMSGGGQSDVTGNRTSQGVTAAQYALTLDIVDQQQGLNLIGYSRGVRTISHVYPELAGNINSLVAVFGNYRWPEADVDAIDTNICFVKAKADQYDFINAGDADALQSMLSGLFGFSEPLVPNSDYDRNGKLVRYAVIDDALHQTANISSQTISVILQYINDVAPAPNPLDVGDQVWKGQQVLSLAAAITMMFFAAALAGLLLQNPFFAGIKNPVPANRGLRGRKLALQYFMDILIPTILFIPVSSLGMAWFKSSKVLTSTNLNGIMLWLVVLAVITGITSFARIQKKKREGEKIFLSDFLLGPDEETKFKYSSFFKALLLGAIVSFIVVSWLSIIENFLGINYQFWCIATMLRLGPARFIKALPYVVIIFFVMYASCLNMLTKRRLPESGNERKDMIMAVLINTLAAAAPLAILLTIQYGGSLIIGTGQTPFSSTLAMSHSGSTLAFSTVGALDYSFGYCFMMGGGSGICTYLYRKSGNILAGLLTGCMFCGFITVAAFTLAR